MFAAFDALALNLVLSAQALILLFAARRTGMVVFYWLAQVAMVTAFVHFMVVPPSTSPELGTFLGGIGVALVYYVKTCLEEDWYHVRRLLAPAHAALGSIVLLAHTTAYFDDGVGLPLFLTGTLGALLIAAALRCRHAILFAATTLTVALPLLATGLPAAQMLLPCLAYALGALALTWIVPTRFEEGDTLSGHRQTQTMVVAVLAAVMIAGGTLSGSLLQYLIWMVIPVILLVAQSRLGGTDTHERLPTAVNLAIALAVIILTDGANQSPPLEPVWMATWAGFAFMAAGALRNRGFAETGYGILFGGYAYFLGGDLVAASLNSGIGPHQVFESWWAGALVAAVPILIGLGVDRHMTLGAAFGGVAGNGGRGEDGATTESEGNDQTEGTWQHGGDRRSAGPTSRLSGLGPSLPPSVMGLLFLGIYGDALGPVGFGYVLPAVACLLLLHLSDRVDARRMVVASVAAAGALHVYLLAQGGSAFGIENAGPLLLLFVVTSLAIERGSLSRFAENEEDAITARPALTGLVVLATATAMTAIYLSVLVGPAWATAGWSVVGGSMMAAGFFFRSSTYRRVGLVVLGVCLVRVFAVDTVALSDIARIGAFLVLGLILVGIALLYTRYSEELKGWL